MSGIIKIITAMFIWGSLGVFVKNISLESFEIAFLRAAIATIVVGTVHFINRKKEVEYVENLETENHKKSNKNIIILIISGILIGFNWVLLFQSYKYTTISNSTLGYYFAPIIVALLSPILLKEKFTLKLSLSVIAAMVGLFLVLNSQVGNSMGDYNHIKGIIIALCAACLYATVMMLNKYIQGVSDYERTFIQLLSAGLVLLPFIIYRNCLIISDIKSLLFIIILGVLHTGIAYCLYFSAIRDINAQSAALLSYIDPVSSIFFSVIFLGEVLSIWQIIGGSVILLAAFIGEKQPQKATT